jgi:hypothetical protein
VEVDLTDNAFIYDKSFEILPPDEDNNDDNDAGDGFSGSSSADLIGSDFGGGDTAEPSNSHDLLSHD